MAKHPYHSNQVGCRGAVHLRRITGGPISMLVQCSISPLSADLRLHTLQLTMLLNTCKLEPTKLSCSSCCQSLSCMCTGCRNSAAHCHLLMLANVLMHGSLAAATGTKPHAYLPACRGVEVCSGQYRSHPLCQLAMRAIPMQSLTEVTSHDISLIHTATQHYPMQQRVCVIR
jgi:hypothetical protein